MRRAHVLLLLLVTFGCDKKASDSAAAQDAASAENPTVSALADHVKSQTTHLEGVVLERLDASSYSYLRLKTAGGEVWAAVPQTTAGIGDAVAIADPQPMNGFESPSLGRTFDHILFGNLAGDASAASADGLPPGHPPTTAQAGPSTGPIEVDKASGPDGRTVAEVYAERQSLNGKNVSVRGQVVKFTAGVMGRNWLHIRDGSGTDEARDNDLTVTTDADVRIGDVVLITGQLAVDRDFGSGYSYAVIVEQATVVPTLRTSL